MKGYKTKFVSSRLIKANTEALSKTILTYIKTLEALSTKRLLT